MKVLVYGANGWIGSQFIELLSDVKYSCGKARADNGNEVENEILLLAYLGLELGS